MLQQFFLLLILILIQSSMKQQSRLISQSISRSNPVPVLSVDYAVVDPAAVEAKYTVPIPASFLG